MKRVNLFLVISVSFVAVTLVAGNLVFADPEDSQNTLLDSLLQEVEALNLAIAPPTPTSMEADVSGTLICPNTDEFLINLFLRLDETGGTGNSFSLNTQQPPFLSIQGVVSVGQSDLSNFSLQAIIEDGICSVPAQSQGIVATVSGTCGLSETVTFSTNTGITATLTGRVACI